MPATDYYIEDNRKPDLQRVTLSPSGRWSLTVDWYSTKKGSWSYTRGRVFKADGDDSNPVADVKRNYPSFPFTWLENHGDTGHGDTGHDYLVCGADYQGQTFVDLTTGQRRDFLGEEAKKGFGFCWIGYKLLADGKTLQVSGCYWACPHETRFYDVSDPIEKGWPQLFSEEIDYLGDGEITFEDGVIVWKAGERTFKATGEREQDIDAKRQLLYNDLYVAKRQKKSQEEIDAAQVALDAFDADYPDEDEDKWGFVIDHIIKLRRVGDELELVEQWKDDHLLEREDAYKESEAKRKAQWRAWADADALIAVLKAADIDLDGSIRFMYPSFASQVDGDKNPAYFRVDGSRFDPDVKRNHTTTLEWGVLEGEITANLWARGKGNIAKPTFPRTPEGILGAWKVGQEHLASEVQ